MDILLLFEPFSKGKCMSYLAKKLGADVSIAYNWGLRGVLRIDEKLFPMLLNSLGRVSCISMLYIIHSYILDRNIEMLIDRVAEVAKSVFPGREIAIEVRRWDKTYPLTSIEIRKMITKAITEKGVAIPNPDSNNIVFVGIDKDFSVVGYADESISQMFMRKSVPAYIAKNIIAVVEKPQTDYEIMDLIQLSRAIGFRLRLYKPNEKALTKVLNILGIDLPNIEITNDMNILFNDIDVTIALSMYAKDDEKKLIDLVKAFRGRTIAFVLGSEYEDISMELRSMCMAEVRLGPLTGFSMRTSTALAYALGVAIPILAGYH